MNNPSQYIPALFFAVLLVFSAGCTSTGGAGATSPAQAPSSASPASGMTVNFDNAAEREAFLASFDTMAESEMKDWGIPGMAVAIVKDGKVVYAKGYGVKKIGGSDPVTADTVFQIGSTSKAFTSALVAMEVDSGHMKWDDKVTTYVPDFQMKDPWVTKEYTITDSLAQRSGLPGYWGTEIGGLGYSRSEMIHALRYAEPATSFRTTYQYQNIPFVVAAAAVEKTSKKSWEDGIRERIFVPLEMKSATTGNEGFMASPDRVSVHWTDLRDDGTYGPVPVDSSPYMEFTTIMAPAGGINANVKDMGNWAVFQLGDGTYNGNRLISVESMDYMHTPRTPAADVMNTTKDFYCQGWLYEELKGYPSVVWHNGETYGNHAMVMLVPEENLGIVVLSNVAGASLPDALTWKFYNRYFGREDLPSLSRAAATYRQSNNLTAADFSVPRPADAKPPLALSAYTGSYRNDVYGTATVAEKNGNLTVTFGKITTVYDLTPQDGNDFIARCPGFKRSYIDGVTFIPGPDGSIQKMVLPVMLMPGVNPTFEKV